jgi:hypothetical protein
MASLATTTRRVAKHPATRRVGWIVAATAAAAAAVGAAIYLGDKKGASGTPSGPPSQTPSGPSGPPSNLVQPALTAPALTGSSDAPSGTLAVGNMGSVTLHTASMYPLGGLSMQPPAGIGTLAPVIVNVASSNTAVIPSYSTQAGASGISMAPAGSLGTTTLTFTWYDSTGAQQTSTLVVNFVTP